MLKIVGVMLLGVLTGYVFRNWNFYFVQKFITVTIWLLLFLLGIAVGINDQVMEHFDTIGWQAFCLAVGGVMGSVILAWLVYRYFFSHR